MNEDILATMRWFDEAEATLIIPRFEGVASSHRCVLSWMDAQDHRTGARDASMASATPQLGSLVGMVTLHDSIPHNPQVRDFLLTIESEDEPLGINTHKSPLWTEPIHQVPLFEILRLVWLSDYGSDLIACHAPKFVTV